MELPKFETIAAFVKESNAIEGITTTRYSDVKATHAFLSLPDVSCGDLQVLVSAIQSGAILRNIEGLDVRVGDHVPISGGPEVARQLTDLLDRAMTRDEQGCRPDPWSTHVEYEMLHPFTDGNGRSGRALWAWMMCRIAPPRYALSLGFLQEFYYQTLRSHDEAVYRAAIAEAKLEALGEDE